MSDIPYQDKPSIWSSHARIAARLGSLAAQSKVLDVGTATGMLVRRCDNKSLRFFGIESNPDSSAIARPYYEELWTCNLNEVPDAVLTGYDAIILADVLEHLPAPDVTLSRIVGLQAAGTLFLLSIPNVANLWMRLHLLMGRFEYADRGIFDRTHLRFFTRKTAVELVTRAGLKIQSIKVTPVPLELISPFFVTAMGRFLHMALARLTGLFPTLLGYQFIVEAKKP
jgi:2-polyprenyl-3-methyl-5-hydroxy-6-metoxy-1,4-benzoquinol methylase